MNCPARCFFRALVVIVAISFLGFLRHPAHAGPAAAPQGMKNMGGSDGMAHQDHKPKHGGSFFMSLDNLHHLEGVLLPPNIFRVYLYDDHTKPLKPDQVKLISGTIQVGDSDSAPKIPLGPGKKKEALDAMLPGDVKLPVSITLLMHWPAMAPGDKPELFNFTFSKFTDENGPGTSAPMGNMKGM